MKKIILLFSLMAYSVISYGQTLGLTTTSTTVPTGTTITSTGTGESSSVYFKAVQAVLISVSPSQYQQNATQSAIGATYFNPSTHVPTSLQTKVISTAPVPITVTYDFQMVPWDAVNNKYLAPVDCNITVTINPAPTIFYNVQKSQAFTKNNCGAGYQGSSVTYTVAAAKYSSTISQADADSKATADITANGQNYANVNGTCLLIYYNVQKQGSYYDQSCSQGYYGATPVIYTVPAAKYSSTVSQSDADSKAQADVTANGQAYANVNGTCTVIPPPVITGTSASGTVLTVTYTNTTPPIATNAVEIQALDNLTGAVIGSTTGTGTSNFVNLIAGRTYTVTVIVFDSQHTSSDNTSAPVTVTMPGTLVPPTTYYNNQMSQNFVDKNCGAGYTGSTVAYTVPAMTYTSLISLADANSKAQADINANGQNYANTHGTCTQVSGVPTFTITYGGHGGIVTFAVTPNIPYPSTSILYWTDTNTGQTGGTAGNPTGWSSTLIDGHTYQIYFVCYGGGTPGSATSATQSYYMP